MGAVPALPGPTCLGCPSRAMARQSGGRQGLSLTMAPPPQDSPLQASGDPLFLLKVGSCSTCPPGPPTMAQVYGDRRNRWTAEGRNPGPPRPPDLVRTSWPVFLDSWLSRSGRGSTGLVAVALPHQTSVCCAPGHFVALLCETWIQRGTNPQLTPLHSALTLGLGVFLSLPLPWCRNGVYERCLEGLILGRQLAHPAPTLPSLTMTLESTPVHCLPHPGRTSVGTGRAGSMCTWPCPSAWEQEAAGGAMWVPTQQQTAGFWTRVPSLSPRGALQCPVAIFPVSAPSPTPAAWALRFLLFAGGSGAGPSGAWWSVYRLVL